MAPGRRSGLEGERVNAGKAVRPLASVLFMAACLGCASSRMVVVEPLSAGLSSYDSVSVAVECHLPRNLEEELSRLQQRIIAGIVDQGVFASVLPDDGAGHTDATLLVKVRIVDIAKVGRGERLEAESYLGVQSYGGDKAMLHSVVSFVDGASGDVLGKYSIMYQSSPGLLASGATTGDLIEKTAKRVAAVVAEHHYLEPDSLSATPLTE
jgi:hypothetical protein